ncbi:2-oxoacid:ferredoxin oxidoreductase subunit beta, partial [Pimelobacter simplex]|nr:2-oxoacid:ferredoxin oxidoreductase subunit beta [Pimelobacter simplex]
GLKGPDAADQLLRLEPGLEVTVDGQTWTHDPTEANPTRQFAISRLDGDPDSPVPVGIFRQVDRPTYDDQARAQVADALAAAGPGDLQALLDSGDTWSVAEERA